MRHLAAEVEQVVLDAGQRLAHVVGQFLAEQQADDRVEFVDVAERGDARCILADARAVAEAGGAGVAGAGVDLGRESVAHGEKSVVAGRR